eukprot:CAMPEP_0204163236 /NCGR_PEP_ID=MMETSP0361-20130328/36211_1 /ASSEMBLY_ACC=CAM_ASM_000343 /TAXON_ID=268821 /ORGANISM="Scrippsiella Hangoei, Strain SHTV-5" /LENGTH=214 /DNA_ID=CAMNT_0051119919 /DNA_START=52 /DNA_END=693 /DNA_ORIENTATION=+
MACCCSDGLVSGFRRLLCLGASVASDVNSFGRSEADCAVATSDAAAAAETCSHAVVISGGPQGLVPRTLPAEVWRRFFLLAGVREALAVGATSWSLHGLAEDPLLWQAFVLQLEAGAAGDGGPDASVSSSSASREPMGFGSSACARRMLLDDPVGNRHDRACASLDSRSPSDDRARVLGICRKVCSACGKRHDEELTAAEGVVAVGAVPPLPGT